MKVAVVTMFDTFHERMDGLVSYYEQRGDQVIRYESDYSHRHKTDNRCVPGAIMVKTKPYQKNLSIARIRSHQLFARRVKALIDEEGFDLVHAIIPGNSLVKELTKNKTYRLVIDVADVWPETLPIPFRQYLFFLSYWRRVRDAYLPKADVVLAECQLFAQIVNASRVSVVYWPGAKPIVERKLDDLEILRFAYVGSISHLLDIDRLVGFLKEIGQYRQTELVVIGAGEKEQELLACLDQHEIRYTFAGMVFDEEKKKALLADCHFGLNVMKPNVVVGLSMKSMDYLRYGLPLINSLPGDSYEWCKKGMLGLNLDQADLIKNLLQLNVVDYRAWQLACQQFYLNHLSYKAFCAQLDRAQVRGKED